MLRITTSHTVRARAWRPCSVDQRREHSDGPGQSLGNFAKQNGLVLVGMTPSHSVRPPSTLHHTHLWPRCAAPASSRTLLRSTSKTISSPFLFDEGFLSRRKKHYRKDPRQFQIDTAPAVFFFKLYPALACAFIVSAKFKLLNCMLRQMEIIFEAHADLGTLDANCFLGLLLVLEASLDGSVLDETI